MLTIVASSKNPEMTKAAPASVPPMAILCKGFLSKLILEKVYDSTRALFYTFFAIILCKCGVDEHVEERDEQEYQGRVEQLHLVRFYRE